MICLNLYPAIDLKAGQCVRLAYGEMDSATLYNEDPADQAGQFAEAGFDHIHIVDLDGAFTGQSENRAAVEAILKATSLKAQLGGGLRDLAAIEGWLASGVSRVILGTAAVKDPQFVAEAARKFPEQVAIGLDARDGEVKTDGWAGNSGAKVLDIARRYEDAGVAALIYTDISRDGVLSGVNVTATAALAEAVSIPVIASGGVAGIEDIAALQESSKQSQGHIDGVIIGRALYDGRINAREAIDLSKSKNQENR